MSNDDGCGPGCAVALAINVFLWFLILMALGFVFGWSALSYHGVPVL